MLSEPLPPLGELGRVAASATPPVLIPPSRDFSPEERQKLAAAQQRLQQARRNDREAREFEQAIEQNEQPRLLQLQSTGSTGASASPLTGPGKGLEFKLRVSAPPPSEEAPPRAAPPFVLEAARKHAVHTSPQPLNQGTPEARAARVVEVAEAIMRERLLAVCQAEREAKGKPGGHIYLRADRMARNLAVLRALVEGAYTLIEVRGQQGEHVTSYTYFTVLDMLPVVTGFSPATCERATADLRAAGYLATWSDWTTTEFLDKDTGELRETRARTGVWVCINLRPDLIPRATIFPAELPRDESGKPVPQRDLTADRRVGRTAYQARKEVRESISLQEGKVCINHLIQWALGNTNSRTPVGKDALTSASLAHAATPQELVWSLQAVLSEHPQRRGEIVEQAARTLARLFRDDHSRAHYCRVLWRAIEAEFKGLPAFRQLEAAMLRTLITMQEIDLQRPGAYLMRQLEQAGWLDSVYRKAE